MRIHFADTLLGVAAMNIQDLGSIGELVAAIATLATLVYLAVQMRKNTAATRSTALLEIQRDVRSMLTADPDTNNLAVRMIEGETLTPGEQALLVQRYVATFRTFESIWFQAEKGTLEKQLLEGYMHHLRVVLNAPLARALWDDYQQGVFHPNFLDYVNKYIAIHPPKAAWRYDISGDA